MWIFNFGKLNCGQPTKETEGLGLNGFKCLPLIYLEHDFVLGVCSVRILLA